MGQALEMCVNCENKRGCDTCTDLHNWIMEHLEPEQKWISVKDRLPTEEDSTSGMVIAVENDNDRFVKPWHWDIVAKYANEFTHWMPLPEPPERDDE